MTGLRYWPLGDGRVITSGFGARDGGFHWGTDFGRVGGSGGLPVYAAQTGTVVMAGPAAGFGGPDPAGWLVVDHPAADGGGTTVYGHILREVSLGAHVTAGQRIGRVNPDPDSNGGTPPHLHFEVHRSVWVAPGPDRLDPLAWLADARDPESPGGHMSNPRGLDYAAARPSPAAIRDAGYSFVVRYLSPGGASLPGKLLTPAEADGLRAAGVEIVSNWESYADRMLEGWTAGIDDAHAALAQVLRCGGDAGRPIYFSADWDARPDQQDAIDAYLRGAATVVGAAAVGVYGGYWVVRRCLDNGTARWAWQCDAWSGGNVDPRAQLRQLNRAGFAYVDGVQCDINEATTPDYGQWSATGEDTDMTPEQDAMLRTVYEELTKRFPSRSKYRDYAEDGGEVPVDSGFGMVLNIDARVHEEHVERAALMGEQWAIDRVRREAADGDAAAAAVLARIGEL
ncbi:glycoside hydrolase domain-containing protein [Nocardia wallacei]|uniref:glycoside hydrolase domain-containing protein n=1 Tax=Nocardia wallacei TaxID=480035 RepID=UPI0024554D6A|nr:glycoside hydrolase domain-containing protein [Nocardia wallacei]